MAVDLPGCPVTFWEMRNKILPFKNRRRTASFRMISGYFAAETGFPARTIIFWMKSGRFREMLTRRLIWELYNPGQTPPELRGKVKLMWEKAQARRASLNSPGISSLVESPPPG